MADREKVIKGLECCSQMAGAACNECPYANECEEGLMAGVAHLADNALSLIKEQEPRVMTLEEATGGDECWFEHINGSNGYADVYCHWNGAVWVSRINKIVSMIQAEAYGKQWRCWSYRPTDEQRKAVKWK